MVDEKLLIMRTKWIKTYSMYEKWFIALGKYLLVVGLMIFISNYIGYMSLLTKSYVILAMGFISMILPGQAILGLLMGVVVAHLSVFNLILGVISGGVFLSAYIMFIRLYPKESILIIITMISFTLKIEYLIQIVAALFGNLACAVAIFLGILGRYCYLALEILMKKTALGIDILDLLNKMVSIAMSAILMNREMIATLIISLSVFLIVYFIKNQAIDYAPYVAIVMGGAMNLLGFLLGVLFLKIHINMPFLFIMSGVSVLLAVIMQWLALPLDYTRTEIVQFEDEDNFYHVKIIPKMTVNVEPKKVEQIYTMTAEEGKEIL